ncbi:uncharacterized protein LOC141659164 [Apium graveolens]|uniref:uncharacterized protein LOC141659164 n=1 Tax=Apium graveolens TaxID=4045 RepID=UPI003D7BA82A
MEISKMGEQSRRKKYKKMGIYVSILVVCSIVNRRRHKIISRSLRLESEKVRNEILAHLFSNAHYCRSIIRMSPGAFLDLCKMLIVEGNLRPTTRATVEEQVVKSFYLLGHNVTVCELSVFFRRSGETVSRHFHNVLNAIIELEDKFLIQPNGSQVSSEIFTEARFYPYFKDCIGTIDGTHVRVKVSSSEAVKYRGRKDYPTQNVLAACAFDMKFSYVLAGWEVLLHTPEL